jgi:hypothetical protein
VVRSLAGLGRRQAELANAAQRRLALGRNDHPRGSYAVLAVSKPYPAAVEEAGLLGRLAAWERDEPLAE